MEREEREAIAAGLLERRNELLRGARGRSEEASALQTSGVGDLGDHGVVDERTELLSQLGGRERERVREIDDALHRLNRGTYGQCEDCGVEIAARRLRAQPAARFCAACQEQREAARRTDPTLGKI